MSNIPTQEQTSNEKKCKPRRAEREIYRPGALRQLKEVSKSPSGTSSVSLKKEANSKKSPDKTDANSRKHSDKSDANFKKSPDKCDANLNNNRVNIHSISVTNKDASNTYKPNLNTIKSPISNTNLNIIEEKRTDNSLTHQLFSKPKQSNANQSSLKAKPLEYTSPKHIDVPHSHKTRYERSPKNYPEQENYRHPDGKYTCERTRTFKSTSSDNSKRSFSSVNKAEGAVGEYKESKPKPYAKGKLNEEVRKQERSLVKSSGQPSVESPRKNQQAYSRDNFHLSKSADNSRVPELYDNLKSEFTRENSFDAVNHSRRKGHGKNRFSNNHRLYEPPKRKQEIKSFETSAQDLYAVERTNSLPSRSAPERKLGSCSALDYKDEKVPRSTFKIKSSSESKAMDTETVLQSNISKYMENIDLKLNPSSEETASESEDCVSGKYDKTIDPMTYIDYKENTFFKGSHDSKNINNKTPPYLKSSPPSNMAWSDEKCSPAQGQKKRRGKPSKDLGYCESPGRRGIIQINNSPNIETNSETVTPGQRLLFNPNNPSKPLAVMPSARDLPPSLDHPSATSDKDKSVDGSPLAPNLNELNADSEGSSNLDLSIFYSIQKGELDINYFVSSNQLPQEFRRIMDIRMHLQVCYKQLLVSDIRLCQEKNVEGALWKSLYYIIIEKLREYISREPTLKERSLSTLMMIVEEGLGYLQSLLTAIQKAYRFSLEAHFEEDLTTLTGTKNRVRHALYSCQKILLSMGDLARYKEQYNSTPNYSYAKKWYERALQVNPRNGRPFNQLAIIAVSQKRSLDVVYYYIRSLTASNPFTSARDSLISMFDDIRRKYESLSKPGSTPDSKDAARKPEAPQSRRRDGNLRQEIWIRPDSGATNKRTLSQTEPDENSHLQELLRMPHEQLMKQFLTSYLHCHGMLFSRVGLDHFNAVLGETLNLFQALLHLSPPKLSSTHLLQVMAINMFAIDNTQLRDSRLESGYRSAAQDLALLLAQEMFARLAEAMAKLFPASLNYARKEAEGDPAKDELDAQRLFMNPLTHLVPAAKVWCDWLLYQSSVWNPPPIAHDVTGVDTWGVVGELATMLKGMGPPDVALLEDGPCAVTLPEDVFLRGFTPVVSAQVRACYYAAPSAPKERAQDWVRVRKLQLCLSQFLCGVEPPVLRLQKTDQGEILVSVVAVSRPDSPAVSRLSLSSTCGAEGDPDDPLSEGEDGWWEGEASEDEADLLLPSPTLDLLGVEDTPLASTVKLLAHRKRVLENRQRQQRKMQAILEGQVTLEMEVKPRYLVPDTNCFIEKLDTIKALIDNTSYTFMVPLIVLAELDGLSRDAAVEKYGDAAHAVNVREGSATALLYIQSNKNPRLKCVTSQGSVTPANMFSLEIDTLKDMTNDDKILSCCMHLCSDSNKRRPIKENVRRLHREVVLLTEDRNLRVKAYATDVPVRDLSDFAHWAGVK